MIIIKTTIGIVSIIIALSIVYLIGRVTRRIMDPERQHAELIDCMSAGFLGVIACYIISMMVCLAWLLGEAVLRAL
jgi:hypothetical protein